MIQGTTRLYAIIGDPIEHVRTPQVFNAYFAEKGIDAVCVAIHIPADLIAEGLTGLRAIANLDGFIVTAPYKAEVAGMLDALSGDAEVVGAVNTVRRRADGVLEGTMLDGRGFVAGLQACGHTIAGKRVFLVGAGGAASAIACSLAVNNVAEIAIANRTPGRAEALAGRLALVFPEVTFRTDVLDPAGCDIAINATPLGLQPEDPLPFNPAGLAESTLVAEVIMKPRTTRLLDAAAARGLNTHEGIHMLENQKDLMMSFFGLGQNTSKGM